MPDLLKNFSFQCLSRALREENPKLLMAASVLLLPFQPFMVSAVHTGMMEVNLFRFYQPDVCFRYMPVSWPNYNFDGQFELVIFFFYDKIATFPPIEQF